MPEALIDNPEGLALRVTSVEITGVIKCGWRQSGKTEFETLPTLYGGQNRLECKLLEIWTTVATQWIVELKMDSDNYTRQPHNIEGDL